jgi:carotenoid cleavage dioxygenase-like enzyme
VVVETFLYGENKRGGEIQFVPKENAREEDEGYLVGFVHDEFSDISTFWVVDAQTMDSAPICILEMPRRVPYGFHSLYVTVKELVDAEMSFQSSKL